MESLALRTRLDAYFREVDQVIIRKQNPVTGLLPASTAVSNHGDYRDAWVRDNVYSILAVWGLGLAYRALDDDGGRGKELEGRTVLLMRGLLRSMMAQAHKVEAFKHSRDPRDALHAKYDTLTGGTVVGDDEWGHLQIDATSVFLLTLAQMISSGLDVVWTQEEVNFVQNLVYYIERAYRVADYGIWERGAKSNHGRVELNASSLGMAKAALEALSGFNLFGARGSQRTVIHVCPDNIAQSEITLSSLLPRESNTKEVDAAVLSVVGFPAFAVHDQKLRKKTRAEIRKKLEGRYGLKRFLRDGHQTVLEDEGRLHYEAEELKRFEDIESEWPLFFCYLYLDGLFRHDAKDIAEYREKLETLIVERDGQRLLPELYFVPRESVEAERRAPGSQTRLPNDNVPLVWAQSLYLLGRMIEDGILRLGDVDPMGRRRHKQPARPVVQILLLAEDEELQAELAAHGVRTDTLSDISPVEVYLPDDIALAHSTVGKCDRLGLSGRVTRALKSLMTSRIYQIENKTVLCLAPFFLQREFYLAYDMDFLVNRLRGELSYLWRHWAEGGRPTIALLLTRSLLSTDRTSLFELYREVAQGKVGDVPVYQGGLPELLPTASFERIDRLGGVELPQVPLSTLLQESPALPTEELSEPLSWAQERAIDEEQDDAVLLRRLSESHNLYEQIEILDVLIARRGLSVSVNLAGVETTLQALCAEVYEEAGRARNWAVVRHAAGLLRQVDVDLNLACAALLVAHKHIQVGRAYNPDSLIVEPLPDQELLDRIERYCRDDVRDRVLTQELLLYLGDLIRAEPQLFRELPTVRVSHLMGLLTSEVARETNCSIDVAFDNLVERPPHEIKNRLYRALQRYAEIESLPQQLERMGIDQRPSTLSWREDLGFGNIQKPVEGWRSWRQYHGVVDRRPTDFYARTFEIFRHAQSIVIGDKLDRRNRIPSSLVLSDMTPGEKSFAYLIEHLLNKASAPEYRQLTLEALSVLSSFFEQNPEIELDDTLYVDAMIGHAVRILYLESHPGREGVYGDERGHAWEHFYESSPRDTSSALFRGLRYLLFNREESRPIPPLSVPAVPTGRGAE